VNNTLTESVLAEIFAAYKCLLWSLSYRLTGNAADADDVVQETFIRAWQHPPARTDAAWLPWLVRVASNLGHDLLRWRRRSNWSCEATAAEEYADVRSNPAMPLELLENVTAAFLHAMEALTPRQQLLLMLRDVFDYSVRDTASVLQMSEANVKTALHRARRRLMLRPNTPPTVRQQRRTIVRRLLACLRNDDALGVVTLLAE